ncbi:family 20 glycosylhydrolase [Shewanella nanhaiensis]|uniref:beta-N-acetylhexosaminidase n=1 Tax=Shewanella nanhaiensis TaxID=2864872 RepID=A0ABS7E0Y2_9GAMM|nr:family 20 glycosylhydrolase [Shewanella nanhaiensis]MBW8183321.1 carbohydate-binding domain-containing protein [Shewanella nanhaiensis]
MRRILMVSLLAMSSAHAAAQSQQAQVTDFAKHLQVSYELLNASPELCPQELEKCYYSRIRLTTKEPLNLTNWNIYFSQLTPVIVNESSQFDIEHINGDLHRITPTKEFNTFTPGTEYSLTFYSQGSQITRSEFMPNFFVHTQGGEAQVIDSTRIRLDPETGLEIQPYLEPFTDKQKQFRVNKSDNTQWADSALLYQQTQSISESVDISAQLIPQPQSLIITDKHSQVDLTKGIVLKTKGVSKQSLTPAMNRLKLLGVTETPNGLAVSVNLSPEKDTHPEQYTLTIDAQGIQVAAHSQVGAFYGLISLAGLIDTQSLTLPYLTIEDQPRYSFRGLHIDVARNFLSKGFILSTLDQMAAYKLNKLHLHLADDEGWRLEIPGLAELTEVGSRRCFNAPDDCLLPQLGSDISGNSQSDGYYSVDDYLEILAYANARHIQVIPSLDMPGHSRAAIHSMEARYRHYLAKGDQKAAERYRLVEPEDKTQYSSIQHYKDNTLNVCLDSTYLFIDKVIDEVQQLHQQAGTPLTTYHIGADETAGAWIDSPACDQLRSNFSEQIAGLHSLNGYFIERVSAMLAKKQIKVAGWNDGMGETRPEKMPKSVQTNSWSQLYSQGHVATHKQANYDWDTIISTPEVTYFDFPYEAHPQEPGNHWAARNISSKKVFEFMPDNLPAHAEIWTDINNQAYRSDDTTNPLRSGVKYQGLQGHLWSEMLRSDRQAQYMLFPRLLALAERAWHKAQWELDYDHSGKVYSSQSKHFTEGAIYAREQDWQRFASILGRKELLKLEKAGVFYRIPTVGAKFKNGKLTIKTIFPGIPVEYQEKSGEWLPYQDNGEVTKPLKIRAMSQDLSRKGRALAL